MLNVHFFSGIKRFIDEIEPSELVAFEKVLKSRKCEIEQKLPCDYDVKEPNSVQLKLVFLNQLLPFIGFGFLDNFIMIVAGDYIDETFGITLGISVSCILTFTRFDGQQLCNRHWQLLDLEMHYQMWQLWDQRGMSNKLRIEWASNVLH